MYTERKNDISFQRNFNEKKETIKSVCMKTSVLTVTLNDCHVENVPDISPHTQEVFLQKRFDFAPTGDLITVCKIAAIVAFQDRTGFRTWQ